MTVDMWLSSSLGYSMVLQVEYVSHHDYVYLKLIILSQLQ